MWSSGGVREPEDFDLEQGVPLFPLFYLAATAFPGIACGGEGIQTGLGNEVPLRGLCRFSLGFL